MELLRVIRAKDMLFSILFTVGICLSGGAVYAQDYLEAPPTDEIVSDDPMLSEAPPTVTPTRVVAPPIGGDGYRAPNDPPTPVFNNKSKMGKTKKSEAAPVAAVSASAETQPVMANGAGVYVVQPGDTAPIIAKKLFGSSKKWRELIEFNQIQNADSIIVGQRLKIPTLTGVSSAANAAKTTKPAKVEKTLTAQKEFQTAEPEANKTTVAAATTKKPVKAKAKENPGRVSISADVEGADYETAEDDPAPTTPAKAPKVKKSKKAKKPVTEDDADAEDYGQAGGSYTIQRGDTMAKIAKKLLGSTKRWREIARANPKVNPNKLIAGVVIVVPGPAVAEDSVPLMAQSVPSMGNNSYDAYGSAAPGTNMEPPPAAPPPTSIPGNPAPMMAPPPMMMPAPVAAPVPPPPIMGATPQPYPAAPVDMSASTQTLYREERYRIPQELKPTDITPYFVNSKGYHGLLDTECALYPYISTWHMGFSFRYDKYNYLNGRENLIEGRQWMLPVSVLWTGRRMMAGFTVPFQSWDVKPAGLALSKVAYTSVQDPEIRVGYQIWKNYEGTHAVSVHIAGKFTSSNYHIPFWLPGGASGKTKVGARIGPAEATRGSWGEAGGAYTGVISDRWTSHINLAMAHDSDDGLTRYNYKSALDYRVNHHFSLMGEVSGSTWDMNNGPDGANVDLTLGAALFNERWQGYMGFPMKLQSDWGVGHDFGFVIGANARWD